MFDQLPPLTGLMFAVLSSFLVSLLLGPIVIPLLKRMHMGQIIRAEGPQSHMKKAGTPTMGGLMILVSMTVSVLLWSRAPWDFSIAVLLMGWGYGLIGFLDDYLSKVKKRNEGLTPWQKLGGQIGLALLFAIYCYRHELVGSELLVPFAAPLSWDLRLFYIPFAVFAMVAFSNAANLTDGLDGLLGGVTSVVSGTLGLVLLFTVGALASVPQVYAAAEGGWNLMICAGALCGACLGFLRFNTHPARVIMGDTGSLALGGMLMGIALLARMPLFMLILGGIYVAETVSDVLQIGYFRFTKKRLFRMAPLHHHFELGGMQETTIVSMFTLTTLVLALITLLALM